MTIQDEIRNNAGNMDNARELEWKLRSTVAPLLRGWNAARKESASGKLFVRPHLQNLNVIRGGKAGPPVGTSFVDLELVLVDGSNGIEVSRVLIIRDSNRHADFTFSNENTLNGFDFVASIAYEYLASNLELAVAERFTFAPEYPADLKALLSGNTRSSERENGSILHVFYAPDGSMIGRNTSRTNRESKDTGSWEISAAGFYCQEWHKWRKSRHECFVITARESGKYDIQKVGDPHIESFTLRPGDPEELAGASYVPPARASSGSDLSGTYQSSVSGNWRLALLLDGPTTEVRLEQNGNAVDGSFGSGEGKIFGYLKDGVVHFDWASGNKSGTGKWIFKGGGDDIQGSWRTGYGIDMSGTWNLGKISKSKSASAPTHKFDLNGIYTSRVSRKNNSDYWCFNKKRTFLIELQQDDDRISGKFLSGVSGGIEGEISGDKINFTWYTAKCSSGSQGQWTVGSGGSSLQGYGWNELDWEARKNE